MYTNNGGLSPMDGHTGMVSANSTVAVCLPFAIRPLRHRHLVLSHWPMATSSHCANEFFVFIILPPQRKEELSHSVVRLIMDALIREF